mgnify:CR=1 FL=1
MTEDVVETPVATVDFCHLPLKVSNNLYWYKFIDEIETVASNGGKRSLFLGDIHIYQAPRSKGMISFLSSESVVKIWKETFPIVSLG